MRNAQNMGFKNKNTQIERVGPVFQQIMPFEICCIKGNS